MAAKVVVVPHIQFSPDRHHRSSPSRYSSDDEEASLALSTRLSRGGSSPVAHSQPHHAGSPSQRSSLLSHGGSGTFSLHHTHLPEEPHRESLHVAREDAGAMRSVMFSVHVRGGRKDDAGEVGRDSGEGGHNADLRSAVAGAAGSSSAGAPASSHGTLSKAAAHNQSQSTLVSTEGFLSRPTTRGHVDITGEVDEHEDEGESEGGAERGSTSRRIAVDTKALLQHLDFTLEQYGRNPVLVQHESHPGSAPLSSPRSRPPSRPARVLHASASSCSSPDPSPANFELLHMLSLPPLRSYPPDEHALRQQQRQREQQQRQRDEAQRQASQSAVSALLAAARGTQMSESQRMRRQLALEKQRRAAAGRLENTGAKEAVQQTIKLKQQFVSAQRAFDDELLTRARQAREMSASAAMQMTRALSLETRQLAAQRAEERRAREVYLADKHRGEKDALQQRLREKRERQAEEALAHYEAQREQRAEERRTMLAYLRYCRLTNMNRAVIEKNATARLAHHKFRQHMLDRLQRVAAIRDARPRSTSPPVVPPASMYSEPGVNVTHTPQALPGHVYPESMIPSLTAAQRYEALLYQLEGKWRSIGEFCERETCSLHPRDACELCYGKFRSFTASEMERSGLAGLHE